MLHKSIQTQTIIHHEDHTWHIISAESSRRGIHTSNRKRYISFYHRKKLLSLPSKLRSSEFQSSHRFQIKDMHTPWCYQKIFRREYVNQEVQHPSETDAQKKGLKPQKHLVHSEKIWSCLTEEQLQANNLNQEQGSSKWLTSLLLAEEGYILTKQLF